MKTTTSPRRRPGASMRIAAWALSALLVWGQLPVAAVAQAAQQPAAFAQEAADGQTADPAGQVTLALRVIGPEGVLWLPRTQAPFERGTTLEEAVKQMLDGAGIGYDASLLILTRDGQSYGWDGSNYWQFFVADKSLEVMPGDYELTEPVTDAALYYSPWGASLPEAPVECDPSAPHPDVEAFWPAWRGPASTGAIARDATPTGAGTLAWSLRLREADDWATNVSDPVFVGGSLWVAAGSQLLYVDPASGTVAARLPLAAPIDSTCRITYAQGLLLVPLSGGRLQAISASAHKTLWVTDALPADGTVPQQSLSSLTVAEDAVYWATCTPDGVGGSTGGYLCAANLATGALFSGYPRANPRGAGVYWSGPVEVTGRPGLMACGDDAGTLEIYDAVTGTPKGSLNLGAPVRTTPVSLGDGALAVVTSNGVAHRISVAQGGAPAQTAQCAFATSSTSTPALAGDTLVVGGAVADASGYHGRLALIDAATFSVTRIVDATAAGPFPGAVQGAPLVSETANGTWAYFTCNALPGALYGYRLGDEQATQIYLPAPADQQYCLASVIPGPDGALYYSNDSGLLFKILADKTVPQQPDGSQGPGASQKPDGSQGAGGSGQPGGTSQPNSSAARPASGSTAAATTAKGVGDAGARNSAKAAGADAGADADAATAEVVDAEALLADGAAAANAPLPWWPIATMALGAAALVALAMWNLVASKRKAS